MTNSHRRTILLRPPGSRDLDWSYDPFPSTRVALVKEGRQVTFEAEQSPGRTASSLLLEVTLPSYRQMWEGCVFDDCFGYAVDEAGQCLAHTPDIRLVGSVREWATGAATTPLNLSGVPVDTRLIQGLLGLVGTNNGRKTSLGVIAYGAQFADRCRVTDHDFDGPFHLVGCKFEKGAVIERVSATSFSFDYACADETSLLLTTISAQSGNLCAVSCESLKVYGCDSQKVFGLGVRTSVLTLDLSSGRFDLRGAAATTSFQVDNALEMDLDVGASKFASVRIEESKFSEISFRDSLVKGRLFLAKTAVEQTADFQLRSGGTFTAWNTFVRGDLRVSSLWRLFSFESGAISGELIAGSLVVKDHISFRETQFEERFTVNIDAWDGYVDIGEARFLQRVYLRLDASEVRAKGAEFAAGGSLTSMRSPLPKLTSLMGASVNDLHLSNFALSDCRFMGAKFLSNLQIDASCDFGGKQASVKRRQIIADERDLPASTAERSDEVDAHRRVEGLYRQLRKQLEGGGSHAEASDFYMGEMRMRRLSKSNARSERWLTAAYGALSGYGLRPLRTFAVWLSLEAVAAVLLHWFGTRKGVSIATSFVAVLETSFAIPNGRTTFDVYSLYRRGEVVLLVMKVISPLLIALTALAIRNRMKRG